MMSLGEYLQSLSLDTIQSLHFHDETCISMMKLRKTSISISGSRTRNCLLGQYSFGIRAPNQWLTWGDGGSNNNFQIVSDQSEREYFLVDKFSDHFLSTCSPNMFINKADKTLLVLQQLFKDTFSLISSLNNTSSYLLNKWLKSTRWKYTFFNILINIIQRTY